MQSFFFLFLHSWTPIKRANQGRWKGGESKRERERERACLKLCTHAPKKNIRDSFFHLTPKQTQTKTNRERGKKRESEKETGQNRSGRKGDFTIRLGFGFRVKKLTKKFVFY